jgi:hypothetical protein
VQRSRSEECSASSPVVRGRVFSKVERNRLESLGRDATMVRISESGWRKTPKVFAEQGTNLRAFFY